MAWEAIGQLSPSLVANDIDAVAELLSAGAGIGLLTDMNAAPYIRNGTLEPLLPELDLGEAGVWLADSLPTLVGIVGAQVLKERDQLGHSCSRLDLAALLLLPRAPHEPPQLPVLDLGVVFDEDAQHLVVAGD